MVSLPAITDDELHEIGLDRAPAGSVLICTRSAAHVFQEKATLSGRLQVEAHVCVDLIRALKSHSPPYFDGCVFVHADILGREIEDEARRTLQLTRTLAGYDVDFEILADVVAVTLDDKLRAILQSRRSAVVFQNGIGLLPPITLDRYSTSWRSEADQANPWQSAAFGSWEGDIIEPDLETVKKHAAFLVDTDIATLRSMHTPIATKAYHRVIAVWRSNLAQLGEMEGAGSQSSAAIKRLDAAVAIA
ncbi:MAG: hypothetical protein AAFO75_03275 [Pseudomonadota bacterium]